MLFIYRPFFSIPKFPLYLYITSPAVVEHWYEMFSLMHRIKPLH